MAKSNLQKSFKVQLATVACFVLLLCVMFTNATFAAPTQTLQDGDPNINPNTEDFKIVVCDGPAGLKKLSNNPDFVVCDFNGLMRQVQHLINIMMVVGVLVAVCMFSYAGYLYITGVPGNITKAHAIFPKVFTGFIIMLSAWFVVYQILSWLTDNEGFKALLGNQ